MTTDALPSGDSMTEVGSTYSVFVRFRKGRLPLQRRIRGLREALVCAERHRMTRFCGADEVFIGVDADGQRLTIAEARQALLEDDTARGRTKIDASRRKALAITERATKARDRAIVAAERARTLLEKADQTGSDDVSRLARLAILAELSERATHAMRSAITILEAQTEALERGPLGPGRARAIAEDQPGARAQRPEPGRRPRSNEPIA